MRCGALGPHRLVDAALDDPEQRLVVAPVRGAGPGGPRRGALDGEADHVGRARQRRAHVEHHLDVGAEQLLRRDGRLRA